MHELTGGCHCGNISVTYRTGVAPEEAQPRACQCDFCRKHSSSAVSDPEGEVAIAVKNGNELSRYRFSLSAADFLVCRTCGVYVAAFMPDTDDAHGYATLMSTSLDERTRYPRAQATSYTGEDAEGRRRRRRERWTPARLVIG